VIFRGFAVVVVLMVAGCSSVAPKHAAVESEGQIKWRQHHAQVASLDQWDISGRIGVRTADTGGSANLRWRLDNGRDQIDLFGPFGGGRIRLDIDPDGARLRDGEGKEFFAATASQALFNATGWHVPLEVLGYWVRGVPAPGEHDIDSIDIDEAGRLTFLKQQGWEITFREYAPHQNFLLPRKIRLSASNETIEKLTAHEEISGNLLVVKLFIEGWAPASSVTEVDQ